MPETDQVLLTHRGGCHCRRVVFEVDATRDLVVKDCNCSMCRTSGFWHLIVPASRFHLLTGAEFLTEYTFNTGVAKHRFCRVCGVKSFYIPRSNPNGVDVNARCLDEGTYASIKVEPFDGSNWEGNAASLAHLSGI